ncbi:hypothetical protein RRG08_055984 [Elysia crispata]|uniref:Uncharacterized protein n=1 Tax=Elysia crispata TaxID=231223 RepID=A0AAE1DYD8_9GAST|nr:hypothetical protein RRG08_055984 [Elysia crispata]
MIVVGNPRTRQWQAQGAARVFGSVLICNFRVLLFEQVSHSLEGSTKTQESLGRLRHTVIQVQSSESSQLIKVDKQIGADTKPPRLRFYVLPGTSLSRLYPACTFRVYSSLKML